MGGHQATVQLGGGHPVISPTRFYAFPARPDAVALDAMIIGIISICGKDASVLFDPDSTNSYVLPLFAHFLAIARKSLSTPIYVSTPVGDSIVVDRIYRSYVVTFCSYETIADLMMLDMTDYEGLGLRLRYSMMRPHLECSMVRTFPSATAQALSTDRTNLIAVAWLTSLQKEFCGRHISLLPAFCP
uniref:Uncharacterized protein LOC104238210 n=1 Tax=Nicotiana sylvestris TaxID=4096 RepID=A0A1U7XIV3_NICSY|nr:PREDICTED: uncharacterized protein LOC104238210 [Nicotiana sylvestris]